MTKTCVRCGKKSGVLSGLLFHTLRDGDYCSPCAKQYMKSAVADIPMTTTHSIDGYRVKRYIAIESVEIVVGAGVFSEISSNIDDFFGARSTGFEQKLQHAKQTALDKLRFAALQQGGNAVIGVDLDFAEFSGNRIGLIVNGTIVELEADS